MRAEEFQRGAFCFAQLIALPGGGLVPRARGRAPFIAKKLHPSHKRATASLPEKIQGSSDVWPSVFLLELRAKVPESARRIGRTSE